MDLEGKDWTLVRAVCKPQLIRDLISQGHTPDAFDLCEAIKKAHAHPEAIETIEILLNSGINPNTRPDYADQTSISGVEDDWASSEKSAQPPEIFSDEDEWYPLRFPPVLRYSGAHLQERKKNVERIMMLLLQHGADPYALYRQTIRVHSELRPYPGDEYDEQYDDEDNELGLIQVAKRDLREEYLRPGWYGLDMPRTTRFPRKYGVCSVIHSILQEGEYIKPLLDFLGENLDMEHRDPQGRTLFLSACRNSVGADAAIDASYDDIDTRVHSSGSYGKIRHNPFPQPDNYWRENELAGTTTTAGKHIPTFFEYFVNRGADVLAVDNYGKNAIHHLLEARNPRTNDELPTITASLRYMLAHHRELVNQPDLAGKYPLTAALQRILDTWSSDQHVGTIERPVYDLIEAGADPRIRDPRGNTAAHYLAQSWLDDLGPRGEEQRRLCRFLFSRGLDPNIRDNEGYTALERYFQAFNKRGDYQYRQGVSNEKWISGDLDEPYMEIDREVWEIFDQAGTDFLAKNPNNGQTLLHIIAKGWNMRLPGRVKFFVSKGFDPLARDDKGMTTIDVAVLAEQGQWDFTSSLLKQYIVDNDALEEPQIKLN